MADNITIKNGAGSDVIVATKDISTVHHHKTILTDDTGAVIDFIPPLADGDDDGTSKGIKVTARTTTSLSGQTLLADAKRANLLAGIDRVQIVRPHTNLEDIVSGTAAITDGSSTSVIAAAGSGVKVYVTSVVISNSSATAAEVTIRDGAAGTVKLTLPVPADSGCIFNPPVPLPFSANTAVCADPDASLSTINVTIIGFKSKV